MLAISLLSSIRSSQLALILPVLSKLPFCQRRFQSITTVATSVAETGNSAQFAFPSGIVVDGSGNIFVADTNDQTIRKILPSGQTITLAGTTGVAGYVDATGTNAQFNFPVGLALDNFGNVYVADSNNSAVRKIALDGEVTTLAHGNPAIGYPEGIAVDSAGNVYVTNQSGSAVAKITPTGEVMVLAGMIGTVDFTDGASSAAQFNPSVGCSAVDDWGTST